MSYKWLFSADFATSESASCQALGLGFEPSASGPWLPVKAACRRAPIVVTLARLLVLQTLQTASSSLCVPTRLSLPSRLSPGCLPRARSPEAARLQGPEVGAGLSLSQIRSPRGVSRWTRRRPLAAVPVRTAQARGTRSWSRAVSWTEI